MIESDEALEFFEFDEVRDNDDGEGGAQKKRRRRRRRPTTPTSSSSRSRDDADSDVSFEEPESAPSQPQYSSSNNSSSNHSSSNTSSPNYADYDEPRSSEGQSSDMNPDDGGSRDRRGGGYQRRGRSNTGSNNNQNQGGGGYSNRRSNNSNSGGGGGGGGRYQQNNNQRNRRGSSNNNNNNGSNSFQNNNNFQNSNRRSGPGGGPGGGSRPQRDRNMNSGGGGGRYQNQNRRGGGGGHFERERPPQSFSAQEMNSDLFEPVENEETLTTFSGVLELHPKGYGFIRDPAKNYFSQESDAFVSSSVVERFKLREGIMIKGKIGMGARNQGPRLKGIIDIDGVTVEKYMTFKNFDELTPINPFEQIKLEVGPKPVTMRVMDLLTPIGKGQRALIVAPPRSGKTMLLQDIANSVTKNHPEIRLIVLLIDERPEEVTEMCRVVNGEVIASSMDRDVESHVRISQLIVERGKRIAEMGGDAFILLDSITRTARAFNKWVGNTGRTMTGGLDVKAMDIPKKMFGTARRFDEGGSLTVVGTALIDTGSKMDEIIFQEFKGTGNMELVLSRDLADRRIWPSIDVSKSGTRREEKILSPETLDGVTMLRRSLVSMNPVEAMEQLIRTLDRFPTNKEFLAKIKAIM